MCRKRGDPSRLSLEFQLMESPVRSSLENTVLPFIDCSISSIVGIGCLSLLTASFARLISIIIIIHHYVPSVVNRSAVMDLHRSRSCATVIQSLYDSYQ